MTKTRKALPAKPRGVRPSQPSSKLARISQSPAPLLLVQSVAQSKRGSGIGWAIVLVVLSIGGIAGSGWFGVQLIVNPESLSWVNRWVPGWIPSQIMAAPSKTLPEIQASLRKTGQIPGQAMVLGKTVSILDSKAAVTDLLLPVLARQANCSSNCDRLVELRIYQTTARKAAVTAEATYDLVSQLAIVGPEESFVVAPLVDAHSDSQGSSRSLPLTNLTRFEGTVPGWGIWLNLSGRRSRGDETITYGQIIYYNPDHPHLALKLQWTSPADQEPVWKQITGSNTPELVINQTVGMEPQFEIYQVMPLNFVPSPVQLEAISLSEPALNTSAYRSAMQLARSRLWSTSLQWLRSLKQQTPKSQWTSVVQAQMDLVSWHAQATEGQADGSWANPSQQVLANLIDGRWERALTGFESSLEASQEMTGLLKGDSGRLENRIKAALQVNQRKLEVKAWRALLIAAQQNPVAAIAWLKKQPKTTPAEIAWITSLTKRLDPF